MTTETILGLIEQELQTLGDTAKPLYRMGHRAALENLKRAINHKINDELSGNMTKLGDRNFTLIVDAVKSTGSYDPNEIFCWFEEQLYIHESDTIYQFLTWVNQDVPNRGFGRGNYEERFKEFLKQR